MRAAAVLPVAPELGGGGGRVAVGRGVRLGAGGRVLGGGVSPRRRGPEHLPAQEGSLRRLPPPRAGPHPALRQHLNCAVFNCDYLLTQTVGKQ